MEQEIELLLHRKYVRCDALLKKENTFLNDMNEIE